MVQVQETFMADCTMIVASLLLATLAMLVVTTSAAKFACPGLDALWIWHSFAYLGGKHPFLVRLLALISFLMTYDGWLTTSPNKAACLCLAFLWAGQALQFSEATRPVSLDAAAAARDGAFRQPGGGGGWPAEGLLSALSCGVVGAFLTVRPPLPARCPPSLSLIPTP
ncbi:hypothetical protein T484DRAFT_1851796 [Baffinella frigidus]|nr:hypothetical protein T484DRAFT_1851796 [Cryptophyta sp. CCMP2293]